jgi:hypothetical protein
LLPTGKLSWFVGEPLFETHPTEDLFGPAAGLSPGPATDKRWHHHVLPSSKVSEQVMELKNKPNLTVAKSSQVTLGQGKNIPPGKGDLSAARAVKGTKNVEESALTDT